MKVLNVASNTYYGGLELCAEEIQLQRRILNSSLPLGSHECSTIMVESTVAWFQDFHNVAGKLVPWDCLGFNLTRCVVVKLTSSGYTSNLLALPALAIPFKTIFLLDEKCHNSMWVGARAAQPHRCTRFKHNDMVDLEKKLVELKETAEHIVVGTITSDCSNANFPGAGLHRKHVLVSGTWLVSFFEF